MGLLFGCDGTQQGIAGATVFRASRASYDITGTAIPVDGSSTSG
jgi:hypothetical protein